MGSPGRGSPSPSTAPASAPSGPGSSRCFLAVPLKPCASAHVFCAAVSGASRSQPALRASQTGTDFLLASAASKTAAGPAACFVLSLAAMDEFAKRGLVALSRARGGLTIAVARPVAAEMHAGFAALREHCPMDLLARTPMATLPDAVGAEVRRIVALWRDCRRRFGASGPLLFGGFTAADAMYAPVASRFRT